MIVVFVFGGLGKGEHGVEETRGCAEGEGGDAVEGSFGRA